MTDLLRNQDTPPAALIPLPPHVEVIKYQPGVDHEKGLCVCVCVCVCVREINKESLVWEYGRRWISDASSEVAPSRSFTTIRPSGVSSYQHQTSAGVSL